MTTFTEEIEGARLAYNGGDRGPSGWSRYTVYTKDRLGEPSEELDIDAVSATKARALAKRVLREQYDPGLRIVGCVERMGLYL